MHSALPDCMVLFVDRINVEPRKLVACGVQWKGLRGADSDSTKKQPRASTASDAAFDVRFAALPERIVVVTADWPESWPVALGLERTNRSHMVKPKRSHKPCPRNCPGSIASNKSMQRPTTDDMVGDAGRQADNNAIVPGELNRLRPAFHTLCLPSARTPCL